MGIADIAFCNSVITEIEWFSTTINKNRIVTKVCRIYMLINDTF